MPSGEFNFTDALTVAYIDAANSTTYYNLSFCHELGKRCDVIFYTSRFVHENVPYPPNVKTKFVFFPLSYFLANAFKSSKIRKAVRALEYPICLLMLILDLIREKPDVVHYNWILVPILDLWAIRLIRALGRPIIYNAHNAAPHDKEDTHISTQARLLKLFNRIICLTAYVKEQLIKTFGVNVEKTDVIAHGDFDFVVNQVRDRGEVEQGRLKKVIDDSFVLAFFGQIRPYKGLEYLIKAMPLVLESCPQCKLLIFGNDTHNLAKSYLKLIDQLQLRSNVICDFRYIPLTEMIMYFKLTDIVILPYVAASQSGHIPMLSKMGIPVVASRIGGLPEMIKDGCNGFLIPPKNEAAIADIVIRLFRHPDMMAKIRIYSLKYANEAFSWDQIVAKTLTVYRRALGIQEDS